MWNMVHVLDRPDAAFVAAGAVHEHGVVGVDAAGDLGVAAGAEHGGGAGVGIDPREVVRETAGSSGRGRWMVRDVVQEEGARSFVERALGAAEDEGAELEARRGCP